MLSGPYAGRTVEIELDASGTGWHIYLRRRTPEADGKDLWDIWVDTADDMEEWLNDPDLRNTRWG